jgi:hypothetical protein
MYPPKENAVVPWLDEFIELLLQNMGAVGEGEWTGLTDTICVPFRFQSYISEQQLCFQKEVSS